MKKSEKYYGEVWFDTNVQDKKFAVLSFEDDDIIIETNLHSPQGGYKESKILGTFNGLGFTTFIDCQIKQSASGLIKSLIYNPTYCFIGISHFVNPYNLKINNFYIVNEAIVKWIDRRAFYDWVKKELVSKDYKDEYFIPQINLTITIEQYLNYKGRGYEVNIKNKGRVSFLTKEPVAILEAIDIYDQFQKVLQLLRGGSAKFEKFIFKCPSCDDWQEVYYNDKKLTKSKNTYVHTTYSEVKDDLEKILKSAYSNAPFQFCLDKLMENFITRESSYNKRFTNSISAFEAFNKTLSEKKSKKLAIAIQNQEGVFLRISEMTSESWREFPSKVVRSRNYHAHSNSANKNIFTEYELLYISLLFDFVIGYKLLEKINVSQNLLDKFILNGKNNFVNVQRVHRTLSFNSLNNNK